ncbi:MAG TPA: hypothetical protein VNX69_15470 [Steroidobacteraceae bacterium]|nr:hypothetical protein [Steroidobacteraceae bacterium]
MSNASRIRLYQLVFAALAMTVLGGCGEGYRIDPACLNVTNITDESKQQLLASVSRFLKSEGFEDLGKYEEMIALIGQDHAMPASAKQEELARLNRERTFLSDPHHLRIVWADYSNAALIDYRLLRYKPSSDHFIELNIYEERPGGFSSDGIRFYERFLSALQKQFGASVVVVKTPPPTNEAEYRRITLANEMGAIVGWAIAALVGLLLTGFLSAYLLNRLKISTMARRLIFVVVNTWLVAPLPFPGGYIFVFPGPNLIAFPWIDWDFYSKVASYARVSFPCTLVLCALISVFFFRGRSLASGAGTA